jgi:tRNA dimethylallyltransferase
MTNGKFIIISGPTGTGKTALAVKLAQKYNGELISADSRQIYRGLDIGTGKDHPRNMVIHMVDIIHPNQPYSVGQYQKQVFPLIEAIINRHKVPIIVGGTGLYLDSLINPNTQTYSVKPNPILRLILDRLSLKTLQNTLRLLDFQTFDSLNHSDLHNPRRLIRKIELSLSPSGKIINNKWLNDKYTYLHLSLTAPNDYLFSKVDARIEARLDSGLLTEIKSLLKHYKWTDPGLNTLAYKEFKPYFLQPSPQTLDQSLAQWRHDEHAYARRQKTWFKKQPNIKFIDITQPDYLQQAFELISRFLR